MKMQMMTQMTTSLTSEYYCGVGGVGRQWVFGTKLYDCKEKLTRICAISYLALNSLKTMK